MGGDAKRAGNLGLCAGLQALQSRMKSVRKPEQVKKTGTGQGPQNEDHFLVKNLARKM